MSASLAFYQHHYAELHRCKNSAQKPSGNLETPASNLFNIDDKMRLWMYQVMAMPAFKKLRGKVGAND